MEDVSNEVKKQIIDNEINTYRNTIYLLTIRYKVGKKIGQTDEQLEPIKNDMVRSEQALDELIKIRADIV